MKKRKRIRYEEIRNFLSKDSQPVKLEGEIFEETQIFDHLLQVS